METSQGAESEELSGTDVPREALDADTPVPEKAQVQEALRDILRSVPFRASKQSQKLLRYVVQHSLAGQDNLLRERVIGAEVFGREPGYDAANDPIVRGRVAEVRKRLAQYYISVDHSQLSIRISIPSGTYHAQFAVVSSPDGEPPSVLQAAAADALPAKQTAGPPGPPPTANSRAWWWLVPGVLLAAMAVVFAFHSFFSVQERAFRQFWSPAMKGSMPVLIYSGTNVVYRFSPEFLEKYRQAHQLANNGPEFVVKLDPDQKIGPQNLESSSKSYVTVGDVSACAAFVAMLARRNRAYELRYADDISAGDLRNGPSVLVGGFNNPWTLSVTDPLRFTFARGDTIEDRIDRNRSWSVHRSPDGSMTDDYAIVTRLLNSKTEQVLFTAAGIGEFGTQAASEFLASPQRIAEFANKAPRGWDKRNVQIILHIKVVDNLPGTVDIVAIHTW